MRRDLAGLLALTLACAACGGGGEAASSDTTTEDTQAAPFESSSGGEAAPADEPPPAEQAQARPLDPDAPPPEAPPPSEGPQMSRARDLFVEGMRAYQANDFGRAVTLLTQVDAIVPSAELAYNIAYCYQRMADPDHAVQFFRRYLETGSPSEAARTDVEARIAQMEALRARQRDATMALPPSMDAMTADAAALFASGQEMFRRRRYAPALQAFSAAAAAFQAVGVEVPELVYNLAVTSEHLRSLDDAADYSDEYLRQRPRDPEAERIRAHATELRQRRR